MVTDLTWKKKQKKKKHFPVNRNKSQARADIKNQTRTSWSLRPAWCQLEPGTVLLSLCTLSAGSVSALRERTRLKSEPISLRHLHDPKYTFSLRILFLFNLHAEIILLTLEVLFYSDLQSLLCYWMVAVDWQAWYFIHISIKNDLREQNLFNP